MGVTAGRGAAGGARRALAHAHLAVVLRCHAPAEQLHVHAELIERGVAHAVPCPQPRLVLAGRRVGGRIARTVQRAEGAAQPRARLLATRGPRAGGGWVCAAASQPEPEPEPEP